jgi:LPS sulfotransferase NodH
MWWALQEAPAKNLSQYFDKIRRRASTPNGVFGMKAAYADIQPIIDAGMVSSLLGQPHFIYLTRKDVVLQAISLYVAQKRDLWHSDQRPRKLDQGLDPDKIEVEFDRDKILRLVDRILNDQLCWERFFCLRGIEPLRIEYENLVPGNIGAELGKICRFIGIEPLFSTADLSTSLEIMRDKKGLEWAERIRGEFRS